jgi:hypothetical protein
MSEHDTAADAPLPLHRRLRFDLARGQVLDDTRRYVLMRADVLMGLFDGLPARMRADALRALAGSVARHGADSVRAYAARPGTTPEMLLETMSDSAASLGWGAWRFERVPGGAGDEAGESLRLHVRNSPFAAQAGFDDMAACGAIAGMLEALGGALWSRPCRAVELHCAARRDAPAHGRSDAGVCTFELRPVGPADAASAEEAGEVSSGPSSDPRPRTRS